MDILNHCRDIIKFFFKASISSAVISSLLLKSLLEVVKLLLLPMILSLYVSLSVHCFGRMNWNVTVLALKAVILLNKEDSLPLKSF